MLLNFAINESLNNVNLSVKVGYITVGFNIITSTLNPHNKNFEKDGAYFLKLFTFAYASTTVR